MNRNKLKRLVLNNLLRLVLVLASLVVVLPILWAIITSFKTNTEFLESPWTLPASPQWDNYVRAFNDANMGDYFINSIFVTVLSMVVLFVLVIPASYALSRYRFVGSNVINLGIMAGLFVSANYIVVPLFLLLKDLGGLDSLIMLSIVYAATNLPFNIYLLSGFMKGIAPDYEDAARIDGCGYCATLFRIVVSMCKPGIVTIAMFGFMSFWNEYMLAMTLISSPEKRTLSVGLQNLMQVQKYATDWGAMFAGLVIVMLPTMIFYVLVQKKLTAGISLGGLKG